MPRPLRIAMVAGEASGDLLASHALAGLQARWPKLQSFGIGGQHMAERGFEAWWPSDKLAVRGYIEVLKHYRGIVAIRDQLKAKLLADPPDVFIGVDAPDFNLDLAKDLRAAGIKTIQFVSPSIWAWRGERVQTIKASVDHVLCIFPFEPALYAPHGISASYVGHPLAHAIPLEIDQLVARQALGLQAQNDVVAVLPGSRRSEVQYLGATFAQTATRLLQAKPSLNIVIPAVPLLREQIEADVKRFVPAALAHRVRVLHGQSHTALAACDVVLVASGTATLEAALFKRPMVIAYKMHPLSWWWMRRKKYQAWVGLPNILAGDFVVPEFLQNDATPQALADAVLSWLDDPVRCTQLRTRFAQLHADLRCDTPTLVAQVVAQAMGPAAP